MDIVNGRTGLHAKLHCRISTRVSYNTWRFVCGIRTTKMFHQIYYVMQ